MCLKILSIRQKFPSILYSYIHFLISCYLPCYWQSKLAHVINKTVLFYTTDFYLLLNTYISNISNIYDTDQNLSLASQTICDQMFSYPKLDHAFHIFQLRSWIFFSLSYVPISHLLWGWEGVGIHCKLIPYLIKSIPSRILFPPQ